MAAREKAIIAITMGDAAGVGPEVIVKALQKEQIYSICSPIVVGEASILQDAISLVKSPLKLHPVKTVAELEGRYGVIDLFDLQNLDRREVVVGQVCKACGKAAMEYIARATELALQGEVGAVVTAPINKEATKQAGYGDVGHLEFLARLTGATEYATMLVTGKLRVVHLTTHHSLKDACSLVTRERVLARLKLTHDSFRKWGFERPCIGVAALNPHGGESGLFGAEEIEQIAPAVNEAQGLGIDARGPFPADSIFTRAIGGEFDVVLAMYHDQGHIPIKVHGFEMSVSVALGLPFIRTSVDHGTAFDITGKGIADSRSLEEAIKTAVGLSKEGRLFEYAEG
jgi:4-hydroxythreonine-4-phosphate dehydrogenase